MIVMAKDRFVRSRGAKRKGMEARKPDTRAMSQLSRPNGAIAAARPAADVLSDAIPLYFIGRNRHGFWVARDCEGRMGGIFFTQNAALHFVRRQSAGHGCATAVLPNGLELDTANSGDLLAGGLAAAARLEDRLSAGLAKGGKANFLRVLVAIALIDVILAGAIAFKFLAWWPR